MAAWPETENEVVRAIQRFLAATALWCAQEWLGQRAIVNRQRTIRRQNARVHLCRIYTVSPCPIPDILGPILRIFPPSFKNGGVDRFIDDAVASTVVNVRILPHRSEVSPARQTIDTAHKFPMRIPDTRDVLVWVEFDFLAKRKAETFGLADDPSKWNLNQNIAGVSAADVAMVAGKPSLLNTLQGSGCGQRA